MSLTKGDDKTISSSTIAEWLEFFRSMCLFILDKKYLAGKIGGENTEIEIDESLIGRRKYNKGKLVNGIWIVGLIQRNSKELRVEICNQNKRDTKELKRIIKKHVYPFGKIFTDSWAAYNWIETENFGIHLKVNHQENFVNPLSGKFINLKFIYLLNLLKK